LCILFKSGIINTEDRFQKIKKNEIWKVGDKMKTITRTKYLDRMIGLNGTPDIKIITGIRRSGKSRLMQAYMIRRYDGEAFMHLRRFILSK